MKNEYLYKIVIALGLISILTMGFSQTRIKAGVLLTLHWSRVEKGSGSSQEILSKMSIYDPISIGIETKIGVSNSIIGGVYFGEGLIEVEHLHSPTTLNFFNQSVTLYDTDLAEASVANLGGYVGYCRYFSPWLKWESRLHLDMINSTLSTNFYMTLGVNLKIWEFCIGAGVFRTEGFTVIEEIIQDSEIQGIKANELSGTITFFFSTHYNLFRLKKKKL